jgi:hypothetical protein
MVNWTTFDQSGGLRFAYFRTVGKAIEGRDSRKGSLVVTTNEFEHAVAARTDHKPQKNLSSSLAYQ